MRNSAFLAVAVIVGVVAYVSINFALNEIFGTDEAILPLTTGIPLAIAAFVAGLLLGGRLRTPNSTPWALGLGAALSGVLAVPAFIVLRPQSIQEVAPNFPGLIVLALIFVSAFLGVRATAAPREKTRGTDA